MNETQHELKRQELIHAVSLPNCNDRQSTWRNETFTGYFANTPDVRAVQGESKAPRSG